MLVFIYFMRRNLRRQPNGNTLFFDSMARHLATIFVIDQRRPLDLAAFKRVRAAGVECATSGRIEGVGNFTRDGCALLADDQGTDRKQGVNRFDMGPFGKH